uniref:Major facilitator superfamily (MFS) profile domain-containing protein n=1 Tax=Parascaris univalens TaxID=6257 RepID=A0A915B2H6_PARUN
MPPVKIADKGKVFAVSDFESRRTPWCSIWICNTLQLLNGIQFSLFYTSMWPYLKTLDPNANIDFFGWVIAVFSAGQTVASFIFGVWNQKVKSTKYPASCGMVLMVAGNFMYAILPIFHSGQKWIMLAARLVVGFGTGNLSVLRSYVAVGCAQKDRVRAVSLGIGMFVLGLSIGPAIMVVFTPLGPNGFRIGSFPVTMYNLPAIVMVIIAIAALIVLFTCFQEEYAGVINNKKGASSEVILPKFDKIPAAICIAVWFALQCVATNSEVLMTPLTMALYNWTNQEAIFWNGIIIAACNVISFTLYLLIALTNIGKFDKRKMILVGLTGFSIYHLVNIPWPFYSGPLDYIKTDINSTVEDMANSGGCSHSYEWCNHTTRIPFPVFVVSSTIFLGVSYPWIGSPSGTLFAEIIGPRSQGFMQGIFAFVGGIGRFSVPIISTALFEDSGYFWPMLLPLIVMVICISAVLIYRKRLIPLQLIPPLGVATPYKRGVFYRL